jgi:phage shock protein A
MSKDDFKKFNRDALERYAGAGKTALRKAIVELREARQQLTAATARAEAAEAELVRLHSWAGLMEMLDEHYPVDVIQDTSGDEGPRICGLIREIDDLRDQLKAAEADAAGLLDMLNDSHQEIAKLASDAAKWRDDAERLAYSLRRAEQTVRNLGCSALSGDWAIIALNEAANIRAALAALTAHDAKGGGR